MPGAHAKLSPSSSSRWISCPASVRMTEDLPPEPDSPYAREGTIAHALAEIEAGREFGLLDKRTYNREYKAWLKEFRAEGYADGTLEEMSEHVETYLVLLRERMALYAGSMLLLEQRMDSGVEKCWGTSDAVIVSTEHVEIIDFKYGAGVPVSALGNSQLRLYGCGALDTYGDVLGDTKVIRMTVSQPRLHSVSTEEMTPEELRTWRSEDVAPRAELALHTDDAPFGPTPEACRWCPIAGTCAARLEKVTHEDFGDITAEDWEDESTPAELISDEELGRVLTRIPEIKAWCAAVEAGALEAAYAQGRTIPGWKVIWSGGKRGITDHAAAIQAMIDGGYGAEKVATFKAKGIGELEKLLGKDKFAELVDPYVAKSSGRESLVKESDKRPAISPNGEAQKDFAE